MTNDDFDNDNEDDVDNNYNDDDIDDNNNGNNDNNEKTCHQIKYVEGEQKLMVTVERCEGLKKESGVFGGCSDHVADDDRDCDCKKKF